MSRAGRAVPPTALCLKSMTLHPCRRAARRRAEDEPGQERGEEVERGGQAGRPLGGAVMEGATAATARPPEEETGWRVATRKKFLRAADVIGGPRSS